MTRFYVNEDDMLKAGYDYTATYAYVENMILGERFYKPVWDLMPNGRPMFFNSDFSKGVQATCVGDNNWEIRVLTSNV